MGANGALRKKIQKQNAPPPGGALGTAAQMADPEQSGQMKQAKMRQVEDVTAMYMNLIHSEDTRDSVMQTMKSNPDPTKAVVATANMLMKRVDAQTQKRRMTIPDEIKVASAQYVVIDLVNLGNTAGIWERPVPESEVPGIFMQTAQAYIRQGINNKTIDTTKLQAEVEQLMTPEQKAAGMRLGGGQVPPGPTPAMAVDEQVQKQVSAEEAKTEQARAQNQALKGNIRQAAGTRHDAQQAEVASQQPV